MSIFKILGFGSEDQSRPSGADDTEAVRKIVDELNHLEPQRARFIAAFSFILSRVAHADMDISKNETRAMEGIVVEHGELPEKQAIIVVQMAKTHNELFGGTENFLVTREFNRIASKAEKIALLDCLFAVSAADDSVSTVESNVIRQIADELKLDHKDYIEVRSRYRDDLSVLKDPNASSDA
jgi:uncharacterized tellurite resistance protein B-like protein